MQLYIKRLKSCKGSAHIAALVAFLIIMIGFAFFINYLPVFSMKSSLDNYANELIREAEVSGYVGNTTTGARLTRLNQIKGVNPNVTWSKSGIIDIGEEVTVIVSKTVTVNFFGAQTFTLSASATGKSEVYHK